MSNSIVTAYRAHRAAVAGGTGDRQGGESAEWYDIAQFLAEDMVLRLGELPLDPPLRFGWPYPVARPNGEWPNLILIKDRTRANNRSDEVGWGMVKVEYDAQAVLLFGPETLDESILRKLAEPWEGPIRLYLNANPSLDGRCRYITFGEQYTGTLTLPTPQGTRWKGHTTHFTVHGQETARPT